MNTKLLRSKLIGLGLNEESITHITPCTKLANIISSQNEMIIKPNGLWYGMGFDWLKFTTYNYPDFYSREDRLYAYQLLNVSSLNILRITNYEEFLAFEKQYSYSAFLSNYIDWVKIAQSYDGVEIAPYISQARYHTWYYSWDISSGCIWNTKKIKYKRL